MITILMQVTLVSWVLLALFTILVHTFNDRVIVGLVIWLLLTLASSTVIGCYFISKIPV